MKDFIVPSTIIMTLFISLLTHTACDKKRGRADAERIIKIGELLEQGRALNTSEFPPAERICEAFKDKRINFPQNYATYKFKFHKKLTNCADNNEANSYHWVQIDGNLDFVDESSGKLFRKIRTDETDSLKSICDEVSGGNYPSNTWPFEINKVKQYKFVASTDSKYDKLYISVGEKMEGQNRYICTKIEESLVHVTQTATPSLEGFERETFVSEKCPDGSTNNVKNETVKFLEKTNNW